MRAAIAALKAVGQDKATRAAVLRAYSFSDRVRRASWINQVERFFGLITDEAIRRGVFHGVDDLEAAIERYLEQHNADPKPFVWTARAADILKKVARAKQVLESQH